MSHSNHRSLKLGPALLVPLLLLATSQAFAAQAPLPHTGRSAADSHAVSHQVERPDRVQSRPHHKHQSHHTDSMHQQKPQVPHKS